MFFPCLDLIIMNIVMGTDSRVRNILVVVSVLSIASTSELDKGVTGSSKWFIERSAFDGIGSRRVMI
jgi:hypothetical protein